MSLRKCRNLTKSIPSMYSLSLDNFIIRILQIFNVFKLFFFLTQRGVIVMLQGNTGKNRGKGLKIETVQLSIDVPRHIRDDFRDSVEKNGKTMNDVLKLYIQKYIWKQGELQRNRQKRREELG